MGIHRVTSDADARALAALLNSDERVRPTAVVTTPAQSRTPYIDVDKVAQELEGLADVYLIETGPHTWTFSNEMAAFTQVYGGAGRVYPLGRAWVDDPRRSPLRFAYDAAEGERATERLIDDGLDMAAATGLLGGGSQAPGRQRVEGIVRSIISERAIVQLERDMVSVPPQLAAPGLPIDRVLQSGMVVEGTLEPDSRWLDVREMTRDAEEALASYAVGDVVLARVGKIRPGTADLHLHPDLAVTVDRRDVTGELAGDLRTLLTEDEVLPVRIVTIAPDWRVTVYDADEDPRPAVPLFAGGPPWLVEPPPLVEPPTIEPGETSVVGGRAPVSSEKPVVEVRAQRASKPPETPSVEPSPSVEPVETRPSPLMLDPRRRHQQRPPETTPPPPPEPAVAPAPQRPANTEAIDALKDKIRRLESDLHGLQQEHEQLLDFRRDSTKRLEDQRNQLADMRKRLRRAESKTARPAMPEFADRERGFRHAVEAAWASRTPAGEQLERQLPDYLIGADFLASLDATEGVSTTKVADVVFEVLTGRAEDSDGRDLHRLRAGRGGDDPPRTRGDGAVCWRAALQRGTPSARRLHYWRLPDGGVELSRVVLHDDMDP